VKILHKQIAVGLGCAIAGLASQPAFPQSSSAKAEAEALRTQVAQMQAQMQQL